MNENGRRWIGGKGGRNYEEEEEKEMIRLMQGEKEKLEDTQKGDKKGKKKQSRK